MPRGRPPLQDRKVPLSLSVPLSVLSRLTKLRAMLTSPTGCTGYASDNALAARLLEVGLLSTEVRLGVHGDVVLGGPHGQDLPDFPAPVELPRPPAPPPPAAPSWEIPKALQAPTPPGRSRKARKEPEAHAALPPDYNPLQVPEDPDRPGWGLDGLPLSSTFWSGDLAPRHTQGIPEGILPPLKKPQEGT